MRSLPPGAMGPAPHRSPDRHDRPVRSRETLRRVVLWRAFVRVGLGGVTLLRGGRRRPVLAPAPTGSAVATVSAAAPVEA